MGCMRGTPTSAHASDMMRVVCVMRRGRIAANDFGPTLIAFESSLASVNAGLEGVCVCMSRVGD